MSIVAPAFLLLIFVIIEAGLWMYARNVATLSAREGASVLRVSGALGDPNAWRASAETTAESYAQQVGILSNVTAVASSVDAEGKVTVTVTGTFTDLVPFFGSTVSSSITVEVEQFEPDPGQAQ